MRRIAHAAMAASLFSTKSDKLDGLPDCYIREELAACSAMKEWPLLACASPSSSTQRRASRVTRFQQLVCIDQINLQSSSTWTEEQHRYDSRRLEGRNLVPAPPPAIRSGRPSPCRASPTSLSPKSHAQPARGY
jgi:hypothetical protein